VGDLFLDLAAFQKGCDQRDTVGSGILLGLQGLLQIVFGYGPHLHQYPADADSGVGMVGADDVAVLEHQVAFAPLALEAEGSRFARRVQQLDHIDDGEMFKIANKGHMVSLR